MYNTRYIKYWVNFKNVLDSRYPKDYHNTLYQLDSRTRAKSVKELLYQYNCQEVWEAEVVESNQGCPNLRIIADIHSDYEVGGNGIVYLLQHTKRSINQSINQSNFYSANIPGVARLSGATARLVFKCEVVEVVP